MARCPRCGASAEDRAVVCDRCGEDLLADVVVVEPAHPTLAPAPPQLTPRMGRVAVTVPLIVMAVLVAGSVALGTLTAGRDPGPQAAPAPTGPVSLPLTAGTTPVAPGERAVMWPTTGPGLVIDLFGGAVRPLDLPLDADDVARLEAVPGGVVAFGPRRAWLVDPDGVDREPLGRIDDVAPDPAGGLWVARGDTWRLTTAGSAGRVTGAVAVVASDLFAVDEGLVVVRDGRLELADPGTGRTGRVLTRGVTDLLDVAGGRALAVTETGPVVVDLRSGTSSPLDLPAGGVPPGGPPAGVLIADGGVVVAVTDRNGVARVGVHVRPGEPVQQLRVPDVGGRGPAVTVARSSTGRTVLVAAASTGPPGPRELLVLDVGDGLPATVITVTAVPWSAVTVL